MPKEVTDQATELLANGAPFISDAQLQGALDKAGVPPDRSTAIVDENATARIKALRAALAVLAVLAVLSLFFTRRIPTRQPSGAPQPSRSPGSGPDD